MSEPQPIPPADQAAPASEQPEGSEVDIERLAEQVYRLMLAEVRLTQARGERERRRRGER
jgi:hypothetical protein